MNSFFDGSFYRFDYSRILTILISEDAVVVKLNTYTTNFYHLKNSLLVTISFEFKIRQENAMRCNNRDNLLQLSFSLKTSIFSEAYI